MIPPLGLLPLTNPSHTHDQLAAKKQPPRPGFPLQRGYGDSHGISFLGYFGLHAFDARPSVDMPFAGQRPFLSVLGSTRLSSKMPMSSKKPSIIISATNSSTDDWYDNPCSIVHFLARQIYLTTEESPLIHADGAVEHHINGRALAQLDFAPACQKDGSESRRSARARADTRRFPTLIREA